MNFWWVNQKQTHRHEIGDGYMWSPKRQTNGSTHFSYEFMKHVQPGDVIFSYANAVILAVGIAQTHCYSFPKPLEFGAAGINWSDEGWKVDVQYRVLSNPVRTMDHIVALRPLLPEKYSPISPETGSGNQAYLFQISKQFALSLAHLIDRQTVELINGNYISEFGITDTIDVHIKEWEDRIENHLNSSEDVLETEKESLIKARRGQGKYRELVLLREPRCRITLVDKPEHLIASHIKPWRSASNEERLDPENGFMLTPTIDHLFDKGFISFENDGSILLAEVADEKSLMKMGVIEGNAPKNIGELSMPQKEYLNWHRGSIFLS